MLSCLELLSYAETILLTLMLESISDECCSFIYTKYVQFKTFIFSKLY